MVKDAARPVRLTCDVTVGTGLRVGSQIPVANKKMAQFRAHDLTKELAYGSTQQSGQLDTFLVNHFSVHCKLA